MICGRTCPARPRPTGAGQTDARPRAASGVLRAITRMAALRCAAVLLVAVALGTELDLREITARLQDATIGQAAILHCGARDPAPARRHGGPGAPTCGAALLAAALSLSAPLVTAPPALAPPAAFAALDPIGRTLAWTLPPPSRRAHRSRAPPLGV